MDRNPGQAPQVPLQRPRPWVISLEAVAALVSLFWLISANRPFIAAALADRSLAAPATWAFAAGLAVALWALQWLLLLLLLWHRALARPLLLLLLLVASLAAWYVSHLGVVLDPDMLRNVLHTDPVEARELLSAAMLPHLAWQVLLPAALLWRVQWPRRVWWRALGRRAVALLLASITLAAALLALFQPLASLMRNHKELRYLITPANVLWSTSAVWVGDAKRGSGPRQAIGLDAKLGPGWAQRPRPTLLVLVVGETARAANWGLNGYARQTTPQLAALPVLNFPDVRSCGTNTETSLPCMFAPIGRRDYDEARIRSSESLLHVLARAGVAVHWRDNQSGCKGVCDGLSSDEVKSLAPSALCDNARCLDEGLLHGLAQRLDAAQGPQVLVLHMLGNHGPAYFRRYPPAFARFQPACQHDDLRLCSSAEIVNAYDNALLYTDHVLAQLIGLLQQRAPRLDSAVLYVSDHGESLGEHNLFLHGLPYAIAPDVQTRVPMLMWLSDGYRTSLGLDAACLQRRAAQPASHDHLFHSVLGLLEVHSALREPAWDLTEGCRR